MKCVECGRHISLLLCHLRHNWCTLMQNANNAENTAQNGENLLKLSTTVQNLYNAMVVVRSAAAAAAAE